MIQDTAKKGRTGAKEVRPEDASQSASMKSRVAPKVVWRSRGDDGGDMSAVASPATTTPGWPPVHTHTRHQHIKHASMCSGPSQVPPRIQHADWSAFGEP